MPKVKVGKLNIYYEIRGKGEPLIILQGLGIEISSVNLFIDEFAKKFRVISPDNRGTGRTDKPNTIYSIEMMAEDVIGLMNLLGIKSAHFIGGSMGSCIVQVIAAKYPEYVNGLVLYLATTSFPDTLRNTVEISLNQEEKEENTKKSPLLMQRYPPTKKSLLNQLEATMNFDGKKLLSQIKAPTLILNANHDKLISVSHSKELSKGILGSKLILIEGDHLFPMNQAESLINQSITFLDSL